MKLRDYLTEAISMAAFNADWYKNPEMTGHHWAIEMVDKIKAVIDKNGRTKNQRAVIKMIAPIDSTDWHTFSVQYSKKALARLQYVLRRIDKKGNKMELLRHDKSGMLKDHLVWLLEYLAWKEEPERFYEYYARVYQFYGMSSEDAMKKAEDYINRLYKDRLKKIFQEKGIKL